MDEEAGIRMTRSRRRLSVEQSEEIQNSPATPNKKRSSKLPKPQLDNIVENAVAEQPKRTTRRSMAMEYTGADEDKVSTPGKRAVRVMSNTSLSESVQGLDSPRGKRAIRRGSLAGSDTETVNTPVRRSRRISKEFNKSPETPVDQSLPQKRYKKSSAAKAQYVIAEESDKEDKNNIISTPNENNQHPEEISQSPSNKASEELKNLATVSEESGVSDKSSPAGIGRKSPRLSLNRTKAVPEKSNGNEPADNKSLNNNDTKEKLPIKNLSMIQANRSLPLIGAKNVSKNKKRSKSFTKSDTDQKGDNHVYYSDNESLKVKSQKKIKSEEKMFLESKDIGDHENINTFKTNPCEIYENKENETDISVCGNSIKIHMLTDKNVQKSSTNISGINKLDISAVDQACIPSMQNLDDVDSIRDRKSSLSISKLDNKTCKDEKETEISSTIFMEDSDVNEQTSDTEPPNSSKVLKNNSNQSVVNVFEGGKTNIINDSSEPMDIDETMPLIDLKIPSANTTLKDLNKSSLETNEWQQNTQINNDNSAQSSKAKNESDYKDKAKECNDKFNEKEKTYNSNKSTLILSINNIEQSSEENASIRSTKLSKTIDLKSKSFDLNMNKEPVDKKNLSLAGTVNVTPIRHKVLQNIGVVTSTPVLTQDNTESEEHSAQKNCRKGNSKLIKQDSNDIDIENSSDEDANSLLDDEAEDVGDEYESGDSQDESERKYAEQNTIPVGGETLESEDDEESNDSNYEKDSFLVSSDEYDNELLSGSGDDLSMSDNELKMTFKSKEKYNRRKIKEQKCASREMFNARHEKKCIPDQDDSDPDIIFANKKRNRLRLDSSKDASDGKICEDEPEMSIIANSSLGAKDPLLNMSIKKELLDYTNANNTMLQDIENINVDQNVTICTNKETENPLNSDNESKYSVSSDDAGITDNYNSLLKDLNNSQSCKQFPKLSSDNIGANLSENEAIEKNQSHTTDVKERKTRTNLSISEFKGSKNKKDNSLLDKLNITTSVKENNNKNADPQSSSNDTSKPLIFHSTDTNISLNKSPLDKRPDEKDKSLKTKNKNKSLDICEPSEEGSSALLELISKNEFHVTDSNKKPKNKDLSFTELITKKQKKLNSVLDKLNITDSEKQKKTKTPEPKQWLGNNIVIEVTAGNSHDESSSDSVDFKLLFAQDEDSNNTPNEYDEANPEEAFIPLKKSQAKVNLLENTNSSLKNDIMGATNGGSNNVAKLTNNYYSKDVQKSSKRKNKQLESEVEVVQFIDKINKKKKLRNSIKQTRMDTNEGTEDQDLQLVWETTKKTKTRSDDIPMSSTMVINSETKMKVQRLPASIIKKLDEQPRKLHEKSAAATATSDFEVQTIRGKRNKPSAYLEDSIHIDATSPRRSDHETVNLMKKPKVLPSLPNASTSTVGFTSNFKVNILKQEKRHDAKVAGPDIDFINFKSQRLYGSSIKRIATEELCRKQKKIKITKF